MKKKSREILEYKAKFAAQYPSIAQGLVSLKESVMQDGKIAAKEKELIALGIAVGLRCAPCIYAHISSALSLGASTEEIVEAASVAIIMAGGPGMAHVVEVLKCLEEFEGK
jgi:AhpD family alkylhydroperoxidase